MSGDQNVINKMFSAVQAIVVLYFRLIGLQFAFVKIRYRDFAKNTEQIVILFVLANL